MPRIGDVLSHGQMCAAEGVGYLQKGMNFKRPPRKCILLMSRRENAPYRDRIENEGRTLVYEGHDIRPTPAGPDPKSVDQPLTNPDGSLTDNGKFYEAASQARNGALPYHVQVYEKIRPNVWVFNGSFLLMDAWTETLSGRRVCKFRLDLIESDEDVRLEHNRLIPPEVKAEVWQRDGGQCVLCGSIENLHFDHVIPFSKGGTSLVAQNIQILCAKHNLGKAARIE